MKRIEWWKLATLLLVVAPIYGWKLNHPFTRHWDTQVPFCGVLARNFLKFGYQPLGWYPVAVTGPRMEGCVDYRLTYHVNHPPLTYILVSFSFQLWGISEWTVRLVPLLFALGCIVVFHGIVRRVIPDAAWPATLFFSFNPMFAYYAVHALVLVVVLFWILASLLAYVRWHETGRRRWLATTILLQAIACYTDWQGYYLAPLLFVHLLFCGRRRWRWGFIFLGMNFVVFGLLLLQLYGLDPVDKVPLRKLFSLPSGRMSGEDVGAFIYGEAREIAVYFTVGLVALSLLGFVRRPRTPGEWLVPCLLLLGLDELLLRSYAQRHDFLTFCWTPFFAASAGLGLVRLWRHPHFSLRIAAVLLILGGVAQSSIIIRNRLTRVGPLEFYDRLGDSIGQATRPDDRLLIVAPSTSSDVTTFRTDRYILWYDRTNHSLGEGYRGWISAVPPDDAAMITFLRSNERSIDWVVMSSAEQTLPVMSVVTSMEDPRTSFLDIEKEKSELRQFLETYVGPPKVQGGFLYWRLP